MRRIVACFAALVFAVCLHLSRSPRSELGGESLDWIIDSAPVIECGVVPRTENEFAGTVMLKERFERTYGDRAYTFDEHHSSNKSHRLRPSAQSTVPR